MLLNKEMNNLSKEYFKDFKADIKIASPGRINLIGEHIDYNGGLVLPAAIDKYITFSFRRNESDTLCNIFSKNFNDYFSFSLTDLESTSEWSKYILGVISEIQSMRPNLLSGFDCTIQSFLPVGSGLSSSAALQCGFTKGLNDLFNLQLNDIEIIKLCQSAEQKFSGTNCGIMDQFAVVKGQENHFIALNCDTLEYTPVAANLGDYTLLLLNTNVTHKLSESEYNVRREECDQALEIAQQQYPEIKNLVDLTEEQLQTLKPMLSGEIYDRATYVREEQQRVLQTITSLEKGDFENVGALLNASHKGLSSLYKVSCKELDFLADFTSSYSTVLGSRMMGGGFGGCTINLVHKDGVDELIKDVSKAYQEKFNIELGVSEVQTKDGIRKI